MVGRTYTFSRMGMYCHLIEVEVDIKRGLPIMLVTGLLSQEVKEARERIRPAITNSNLDFPMKRITINLAPAETVKLGTHYDLAIAGAILKICGYMDTEMEKSAYFGELNLSGQVKWVRGILPMVLEAVKDGFKRIYIPAENYHEVKFLQNEGIVPVSSLLDLIAKLNQKIECPIPMENNELVKENPGDFSDIMGQRELIRAFKIAAAGKHHTLLIGPPGAGKTMASSRISGIMPELTEIEIIEINKIYSIVALSSYKNWIVHRPFRTPHNSSSSRAIIGGGPKVLPGEISLAHKGILFMDEFLEFRSDTLQALRTVIEKKEVFISLRSGCASYPADFLLIAAANPCPCGYYATEGGFCSCSLQDIKRYRKKLRNPFIDRIDLQVKVERINYKNLMEGPKNESSAEIKTQVLKAREIQWERYKNERFNLNSEIPAEKIAQYCRTENGGDALLEKSTEDNLLTARACHKILRIARTIADLEGHELINSNDIMSALAYRFLDLEN